MQTTTNLIMDDKAKRTAARGLAVIQRAPFTRAVYLTGSYAEGRATKNSDIDFFLQVSPGHIWTSRFLSTLMIEIFGLRRTDKKIAGKICLNWVAVSNGPLLKSGRTHSLLWKEAGAGPLKGAAEALLSLKVTRWVERSLKSYQIGRIERDPRTHLPGSEVRYSDQELGFHPPKVKKL